MEPQPQIHCPHCRWEPGVDSRWYCAPSEPGAGCRTRWNTFWTAGCCPGCGHFWSMTQCLSCKQVSPHEAWYHYPADDEPARERDRTLEIITSSFDGWRSRFLHAGIVCLQPEGAHTESIDHTLPALKRR